MSPTAPRIPRSHTSRDRLPPPRAVPGSPGRRQQRAGQNRSVNQDEEAWITQSGARPEIVLKRWGSGLLANVPIGTAWEVIQVANPLSWSALKHLHAIHAIHAVLGPILAADRMDVLEFVVPLRTSHHWEHLDGTRCILAGRFAAHHPGQPRTSADDARSSNPPAPVRPTLRNCAAPSPRHGTRDDGRSDRDHRKSRPTQARKTRSHPPRAGRHPCPRDVLQPRDTVSGAALAPTTSGPEANAPAHARNHRIPRATPGEETIRIKDLTPPSVHVPGPVGERMRNGLLREARRHSHDIGQRRVTTSPRSEVL